MFDCVCSISLSCSFTWNPSEWQQVQSNSLQRVKSAATAASATASAWSLVAIIQLQLHCELFSVTGTSRLIRCTCSSKVSWAFATFYKQACWAHKPQTRLINLHVSYRVSQSRTASLVSCVTRAYYRRLCRDAAVLTQCIETLKTAQIQ